LVRPLSLVFRAEITGHPDLYNPPVPPLVLGFFFSILRPSVKVTAGACLVIWVLSVWLTFAVARTWVNGRVAGLAALFCGANTGLILSAVQGLQYVTAGVFTLLAIWAVFVPRSEGNGGRYPNLPAWRLLLGGVAAGLAFLTHFLMLHLVLVFIGYLIITQGRQGRAVAWLVGGFALAVSPWIARNAVIGGVPWFGLYWHEMLSRTTAFPGESVWRMLTQPQDPLEFAAWHPLQLLRKMILGLAETRGQLFNVVEPVVLFLLVAAVLGNVTGWLWRGLGGIAMAGVLLTLVCGSLLRPDPGMILAWMPVASIVAALQLSDWVKRRIGRLSFWRFEMLLDRSDEPPETHPPAPKTAFGQFSIGTRATRTLVHLVVILAVVFPLSYFITSYRLPPVGVLWGSARALQQKLPGGAVV
jgi:hypothetical protein